MYVYINKLTREESCWCCRFAFK
uniref:Uncharacterized protein n=1 Tax=Rhizophora mucronata TaxID=61149 RepID=A0A2P2QZB8_RHIMU